MMMRILYTVLLRLHPRPFQARFGEEMLLTFEEARATEGATRLLLDVMLSLFRQRFLRSRPGDHLPSPAGQPAWANAVRGSSPPPLGLSPYRLFQGGLSSLALFFLVCLWIQGGKIGKGPELPGQEGKASQAQALTSSDLATIHVECAQQNRNTCSSALQGTVLPDESTDWQFPMAERRNTHELLLPSGPFGIGRVLYRWQEARDLPTGRRQVQERAVFVWYPAAVEQGAIKRLTSVWNYSRANQLLVETHTLEKPLIAKGSNLFPVLLFYPSMNSSSAAYTMQIENLVSHGYVVASLEPLMDWSVVSFTNTQLLPFASDLRRAYRTGKASSRDTFLKRAMENACLRQKGLAADLSFVLDRLIAMNQASRWEAPFAGRLDLSRVGALGHADGGTAAALACQRDQRIRACVSEDGWTPQRGRIQR
jgi:hypothetical protein